LGIVQAELYHSQLSLENHSKMQTTSPKHKSSPLDRRESPNIGITTPQWMVN